MSKKNQTDCWREWLSPLRLTLLVINAICFGGFLVLLLTRKTDGPLALSTVGVGLMVIAGVMGALFATRRSR